MSIAELQTIAAVNSIPIESLWRLSIDQYHEMIRVGILMDGDPVELLEGLLVTRWRQTPAHSYVTHLVHSVLGSILPGRFFLDIHGAITLKDSEPEPDIMIVLGGFRDFSKHHPGPADVVLLIEVADSSLDRDRGIKKRLYAAAGIATYWIINLIDNQIEVYTNPLPAGNPPDYARREDFGPGSTIPVNIDNHVASVPADTLLP